MGKNEACLLGLRSDMPKDVSDMNIIAQDFTASFEKENREWIIAWKWNGKPETLVNKIAEYTIPIGIKHDYEKEIEGWIEKKWLQKHEAKKHGPIKGLVPLMAVVQRNKGKMRPVLDFRELNTFIETFTANTDACADKLRDWRRFGENFSIIDLSSAYMQLKIDEKLWAHQTVMFRGQRFCLTCLGFGLKMMNDMVKRTRNDNPAKGVWNVYGNEATVWMVASSLALGVIVEVNGNIIEDACWLRKDDTTHINMSELDAVIKGLNMGLKWKMNILHICTYSKAVFYWVTDALTGKSRLRTKTPNEMLIRRRLQTITNILDEYKLRVDIKLVPSESNLADALTRVPGSWLKIADKPLRTCCKWND